MRFSQINSILFTAESIDPRQHRRHRSLRISMATINNDIRPDGFDLVLKDAPRLVNEASRIDDDERANN
jgi:hypothetical protein